MFRNAILTLIMIAFTFAGVNAQCETWIGSSQKDAAENAHSIYRAALKTDDFKIAFENWQIAYGIAPAADGLRDFHYTDGIKLYKQLYKAETDEAQKKEYAAKILELYDQAIECYRNKAIKLKCDASEDCYSNRISYLQGRKGYDMYYELRQPYTTNIAVLEEAIETGGNNVEYTVLTPLGYMIVDQYIAEKVDAEKARAVHKLLNEIAEYNVVNSDKYGAYYQQAIDAVNGKFAQIERSIFDCDYFLEKLRPEYEEDPDNIENVKDLYNELKRRGCADDLPIMMEMKEKYEVWAAKVNAEKKAEFEANNPAIMAKKLYDDGDFQGALDKYDEALANEEDMDKKATYHFAKSSILYRKMKKYAAARAEARKAAEARPNWGRPYMLIGDMYGATARTCGDSWNQRLAIIAAIEKYGYAKSIDPEVEEDAKSRMSKYYASLPSQEEAFMRKVKKGDRVNVGCWIGETVAVNFR
ncbi:hypothetical protein GCM10007940_13900 [Portibacter lacus]|uniref:Tetratricopeptide repeat protein n=2 Tax=Portibacter lacus TaxID=1099794 RepID=A0AA37SRR6_9BACT|nr:hypothetical protein GCM10007940_13900 [Portibacter lacus]